MSDEEDLSAWKTSLGRIRPKRLTILDSMGIADIPRYSKVDPMLISPYTLLLLQPNRGHLVRGTNLHKIAKRLEDEAVTIIQAYKSRPVKGSTIESITLHWFYDKTPEEFLKEVLAAEKNRKPVLESVS